MLHVKLLIFPFDSSASNDIAESVPFRLDSPATVARLRLAVGDKHAQKV